MSASFTLYGIAPSGPSYKVALMLSLSGQKFSYRHINLREGAHKKPEFLKINRYGQVPALTHGEVTLVQSGAILMYLAETLGKFDGDNAAGRWKVREWLMWEADKLAPGIYRTRGAEMGFYQCEQAVKDMYRQAGEMALNDFNSYLSETPFLVGGKPTIADIACYGVTAFAHEAKFDLAKWPKVKAWSDRMAALPGHKLPGDMLPMHDMD